MLNEWERERRRRERLVLGEAVWEIGIRNDKQV